MHHDVTRRILEIGSVRITFAVQRLSAVATDAERATLAPFIASALDAARHATRVEEERRSPSNAVYGDVARQRDLAVHAALRSIDHLLGLFETMDAEQPTPRSRAAATLRRAMFPEGLQVALAESYVDKVAGALLREGLLSRPQYATLVPMVPGLTAAIVDARLRAWELHEQISLGSHSAVTYADAQAAQSAAHRRLLELVFAVFTMHPGDGREPASRRAKLLGAVEQQVETVRLARRRRSSAGRSSDADIEATLDPLAEPENDEGDDGDGEDSAVAE